MSIVITQGNWNTYFTTTGGDLSVDISAQYELSENITINVSNVYLKMPKGSTFDGKGFTIDLGSTTTKGLFMVYDDSGDAKYKPDNLEEASLVKNVGVLGGSLNDESGYVIQNYSFYFSIDNCYSTGDINDDGCGGIVGSRAGQTGKCIIKNCFSTGKISGNSSGGIAGISPGLSGNCIISNCYAVGDINAGNCGGICGEKAGDIGFCLITNSYYTGNIDDNYFGTGGITGKAAGRRTGGSCIVRNCYSQQYGNLIGDSNGDDPMDGNFDISLLDGALDASLNTSVTVDSFTSDANQWVVDTDSPIEYPLLKSFKQEEPWNGQVYKLVDNVITEIDYKNYDLSVPLPAFTDISQNTSNVYSDFGISGEIGFVINDPGAEVSDISSVTLDSVPQTNLALSMSFPVSAGEHTIVITNNLGDTSTLTYTVVDITFTESVTSQTPSRKNIDVSGTLDISWNFSDDTTVLTDVSSNNGTAVLDNGNKTVSITGLLPVADDVTEFDIQVTYTLNSGSYTKQYTINNRDVVASNIDSIIEDVGLQSLSINSDGTTSSETIKKIEKTAGQPAIDISGADRVLYKVTDSNGIVNTYDITTPESQPKLFGSSRLEVVVEKNGGFEYVVFEDFFEGVDTSSQTQTGYFSLTDRTG